MPYAISVDSEHQVLVVRYHGVVSVAQRRQAWAESEPILRAQDIRRILIDLQEASPAYEPVSEYAGFVSLLASEPLLLRSRTAFVAPPVHPINHLIEVLADARHYPFRRFADRAAALDWLLSDQPATGMR